MVKEKTGKLKSCKICRKKFWLIPAKARDNKRGKFCSRQCYWKSKKGIWLGQANPRWKGGNVKRKCLTCGKEFSILHVRRNIAKFCSRRCYGISMEGIKETPEKYAKRAKNMKRGKDHYRWKGGITPVKKKIRMGLATRKWRKAVFERDNYTCKECGVRSGCGKKTIIHAHHIKPFALFLELRFVVSNGITWCKECHLKFHGKTKRR